MLPVVRTAAVVSYGLSAEPSGRATAAVPAIEAHSNSADDCADHVNYLAAGWGCWQAREPRSLCRAAAARR